MQLELGAFLANISLDWFSLFTEGDEVGTGIIDDNEDENSANQIAGKIPNFLKSCFMAA